MADDPTPQESYQEHIREAAHQASQDFDTLVAKLGTAGITVAVAVAGFTDADDWKWLVASGFAFAIALGASLLSIRVSADGLRSLAAGTPYDSVWQFKYGVVRVLNWIAAVALLVAYLLLAMHISEATIREAAR